MATEVERLVTLLEARITGYERELRKSVTVANRTARQVEGRFGTMNRRMELSLGNAARKMRGGLAALGVSLTAVGFVAAAKHAIEFADNIAKTADRIGIGVEAYQELAFAADEAGIKQELFNTALTALVRRQGEAINGNKEFAKGFDRLGISVSELRTLSPEDLLGRVADGVNQLGSQADQIAALDRVMSEAGRRMFNFTALGSKGIAALRKEAREMGIVLDSTMVREAERAGDALGRLGQIVSVNLTRAMLALAPTIIAVGRAAAAAAPHIATFVNGFLPDSVAPVAELERRLQELRDRGLELQARNEQGHFFGQEEGLARRLTENDAAIRELEQILAERRRQEKLLQDALAGLSSGGAADSQTQALQKYIATLERAAEVEETTATQSRLKQALLDAEAKLLDEVGQATRELTKKEKDRIEAAVRSQEGKQFTAALAELNEQVAGLERLAEAYSISEQAGRAMESQLAAEAEARKNAEVNVDALTAALERERTAREQVDAQKALAATQTQVANLLAEAEAVGQSTIRWNQYTGAFEAYNREAMIVAETQRILAANTSITAESARAAAEAHVAAAESLAEANAGTDAQMQELNQQTSAAQSALSGFFGSLARGENAVQSLGQALSNLSQQLLQIALNQAFMSIIGAAFGGAAGGGGASVPAGIGSSFFGLQGHQGGRVGGIGVSRRVSPAVFAGAKRYHSGGLVGDEVPAILQRGEIVIPKARARQMQAAQSQTPNVNVPVSVVNTFDEVDVVSAAFGRPAGEQVFVNAVRRNATAIRGALGIADNRVRG